MKRFLKNIIFILTLALSLFMVKHVLQAIIEFMNLLPVQPKAYIKGKYQLASQYFVWQFFYTFWLYIVSVFLLMYVVKIKWIKKVKAWILISVLFILLFGFLLIVHNFEFPFKLLYFPKHKVFNFKFVEQLIIFFILILIAINKIKIRIDKKKTTI